MTDKELLVIAAAIIRGPYCDSAEKAVSNACDIAYFAEQVLGAGPDHQDHVKKLLFNGQASRPDAEKGTK